MPQPRPSSGTADQWSFACHLSEGEHGSLVTIQHDRGTTRIIPVERGPASGLEEQRRPSIGLSGVARL